MRVSHLYLQGGTDLESVAGVLMQYRTKWGYLISTVRMDCPYMVRMDASSSEARAAGARRRRALHGRSDDSGSAAAALVSWPQGTWLNSSVLAGQAHMQQALRLGGADAANFLVLSATLLNGQSAFPDDPGGLRIERMGHYRVGDTRMPAPRVTHAWSRPPAAVGRLPCAMHT